MRLVLDHDALLLIIPWIAALMGIAGLGRSLAPKVLAFGLSLVIIICHIYLSCNITRRTCMIVVKCYDWPK